MAAIRTFRARARLGSRNPSTLRPVRCSLVLLALVAITPTAAADNTPWYREPTTHVVITAAIATAKVAADTIAEDALAPDACRWCEPLAIDRRVRDAVVWRHPARADVLADISAYALAPALGLGLLAVTRPDHAGSGWFHDALPVVETVVITQAITHAAKLAFGRARPYARFGTPPPRSEDNLSFWSGHTSFAFALLTSTAVVASERGYASGPAIWGTGLAVGMATAYLRIAADKHYLTDVLVGAAFGVGCGLVIPHFIDRAVDPAEPVTRDVRPGRVLALTGSF